MAGALVPARQPRRRPRFGQPALTSQVSRIGAADRLVAPATQRSRTKDEQENIFDRPSPERAIQESNLWTLAPEAIETNLQSVADDSQIVAIPDDLATSDLQRLTAN